VGVKTAPGVLAFIKRRVRWYMGDGSWWKRKAETGTYVPDQRGCYETTTKDGGTMTVSAEDDTKVTIVKGADGSNIMVSYPAEKDERLTRLGCAKTKGKMRAVTMQTSVAKQKFSAVHRAAYDHLSGTFDFIVRGQVKIEDFLAVSDDIREGEQLISGDYVSSTDNLNLDAVVAVVEVLAEDLDEELGEELVRSFRDILLAVDEQKTTFVEVVRGSMMGNLVSFVVLCLLNKICLDMAQWPGDTQAWGPKADRTLDHGLRASRINGDDSIFCASEEMFERWLRATASVGFVINQAKTMRSERFVDLNSHTFDVRKKRILPKPCFGFVKTLHTATPESIFPDLAKLYNHMSRKGWYDILNSRIVKKDLLRRGPIPASCVPREVLRAMRKKAWFRVCLLQDVPIFKTEGTHRKISHTQGPPLKRSWPELEERIREKDNEEAQRLVDGWRGLYNDPPRETIGGSLPQREEKERRRYLGKLSVNVRVGTSRLWNTATLNYLRENYPDLLDERIDARGRKVFSQRLWHDDQPGLSTHTWIEAAWHVHTPRNRRAVRDRKRGDPGGAIRERSERERAMLRTFGIPESVIKADAADRGCDEPGWSRKLTFTNRGRGGEEEELCNRELTLGELKAWRARCRETLAKECGISDTAVSKDTGMNAIIPLYARTSGARKGATTMTRDTRELFRSGIRTQPRRIPIMMATQWELAE